MAEEALEVPVIASERSYVEYEVRRKEWGFRKSAHTCIHE